MRHRKPFILLGCVTAALALGHTVGSVAAGAAGATRPARPAAASAPLASLRTIVDHYRTLTWTYERAAHVPRTPSSLVVRRTRDRAYLRWAIDRWTRRAYVARARALGAIHRRLTVALPAPPRLRAPVGARLSYSRLLTLRLRRIYPGRVTRGFVHAHAADARSTLRLWQRRSAGAALGVSLHAPTAAPMPRWLNDDLLCIHGYEGAWDANTGNGYYGGFQMDLGFQSRYGRDFLHRYGTADHWPASAQIEVAARAYRSGRGFWPWPATARVCGLL